jgi:predicted amidohydrolase YtcJ
VVKDLDLVVKGKVITMVNQNPRAEAIGIKDGKIQVVGSISKVQNGIGNATQFFDFGEKTILPGFIDSHTHPMGTSRTRLAVDLSSVHTVSGALGKIKQRAQTTPLGQWILCMGYNRLHVEEKRFPSQKELDDISEMHPIAIINFDVHFSMLNKLAFQKLRLSTGMQGVVTEASGDPTGLIEDPVSGCMLGVIESLSNDAERLEAIKLFAREAVAVGITTVHTKESYDNTCFILKHRGQACVHVRPMVMVTGTLWEENLNKVIDSDILGDHKCVATIADGSIVGHTAATLEPYNDQPETLGMLYYSDDEINSFVEKSHKAGLQISIHCESDRSIEQVLSAYESVLEECPRRDHRHRIEHFELPTMEQVMRAAKAGVALCMQPVFMTICNNLEDYKALFGQERIKRVHPYRSILNSGILVAGASDTPVTLMNPLKGMQACLTHSVKEQRIEPFEALKIFTINGAEIGFEEQLKGSIEEDKLADLVVLSEDPHRVPPEQIGDIAVEMTIVEGKIVYQKDFIQK